MNSVGLAQLADPIHTIGASVAAEAEHDTEMKSEAAIERSGTEGLGLLGRSRRRVLAQRHLGRALIDLAVLALALWGAFSLRFDGSVPDPWMRRMLLMLPWVLITQYFALLAFDVPRCSWRYFGLPEVQRIGAAVALAGGVLLSLRLLAPTLSEWIPAARHSLVPVGAIAADGLLAFLGLSTVRGAARVVGERANLAAIKATREPTRLLLVGAGEAGVAVAREIARRPGLDPIGFLDDDPGKQGVHIHGLQVLGTLDRLAEVCERERVDEILISVARASGALVRRVSEVGDSLSLRVKIIPGIAELIDGKVSLERVRKIAIEDLLRREPAQLDEAAIGQTVRAKVVLVSGAGGSIGSELCRQIARFAPSRLILVERSENALFQIHRELGREFPELELLPMLVDITERARLRRVFAEFRPKLILHAAAHKHVPMLEWNPGAAIENNVAGTRCVAELAHEFEAEQFVMVSTDKAVRPRSVMGASKRCAELLVQDLAAQPGPTRFVIVRFGNVLGSNGSVVPIFKEQIASFGPVTVTHPDMERYFMTIPEASQLVLQAATMGEGGEIFVLDMGEPVRIVDLAHDLIRLSGLTPGEDVAIEFTGLRPGEKLSEELCGSAGLDPSDHPAILVEREQGEDRLSPERFAVGLDELLEAARVPDEPALRAAISALLPTAQLEVPR